MLALQGLPEELFSPAIIVPVVVELPDVVPRSRISGEQLSGPLEELVGHPDPLGLHEAIPEKKDGLLVVKVVR